MGETDESMEKGAWQRKEQDARCAGVGEGIRKLASEETGETTRVLHGLCISRDVGWGRENHDLHPVPARLLGVESTHRGRILLIHLIHVRLV